MTNDVVDRVAGVPYVLRPGRADALVVVWHMGDPPRSAAAMAAAIPLDGLEVTRLYLTLPMFGERMPPGGTDEVMRLAMEDPAMHFYEAVPRQAAAELPAVLDGVRAAHGLRAERIALVGGSMGGMTAMTALAELDLPVVAASLLVPAVQLRAVVDGVGELYGFTYPWSERSNAAAARFDFVARAAELAARRVPIQGILGADDAAWINAPAEALRAALVAAGADVDWQQVPGLKHALAEEPGEAPAPQTASARIVDAAVTTFLRRHLA